MSIDEHCDMSLKLPTDPRQFFATFHATRLRKLHLQAGYWAAVPRRLGRDASGSELAADKRASRTVAHFTATHGLWWAGVAGVDWHELDVQTPFASKGWVAEAGDVQRIFPEWRTAICTAGMRDPTLAKWARQALHRLEQELLSWQEVKEVLVVHGL